MHTMQRSALMHDRFNARVAGGARVGTTYWTQAGIDGKRNAVDQDYQALDQNQDGYTKALVLKQQKMIKNGECTGGVPWKTGSASTGWNDCLSNDDIKFYQWRTQFQQFNLDWSAYKVDITIGNSGQMDDFHTRLNTLRSSYESITKNQLPVAANPAEPEKKPGSGPGDTLTTLVWIIGIGGLVYVVFMIAPLFLSVAATTKAAARGLRNA